MTPSIAQFMRDLEQAWDAHQRALLQRRDLAAALASLAAEPAAAAVRVDPSEPVSAVYTQTVQWSRWLNSRWL